MTDVFISYARADRDRVVPLVRLLEEQGWSVWWDRDLIPGSAYEQVIDDAVGSARCVVVAWSHSSISSEWVQAEAGDGLDRHILVPVLLDDVRVPISFRRKHAARLLQWPAVREPDEIDRLLQGVRACITGEMRVEQSTGEYATGTAVKTTGRRRWQRRTAGLAIFVAVAAGLAFLASNLVSVSLIDEDAIRPPAEPAIAVLGFDGATEFPVAAQLAYEIADSLHRLPGLRVLSQAAVGPVDDRDVSAVGRRLSVDFVVTGRLYEAERSTRLHVALTNTLNGGELWNETLTIKPDEMSLIAVTVVAHVREALRLPASPEADVAIQEVSSEAYLAYLRGRATLRQPLTSAQAREDAIRDFKLAAATDARFGLAYAGLCRAYLVEFEQRRQPDAFAAAEKHCHRALTLDDASSPVLVALGVLYYTAGQYDQARGYLERALALTPFDADALRGLGDIDARMGLVSQAEESYRTAIRVEPTYWENYRRLGGLYYAVGRYEHAAEQYRREADLNPNKAASLTNLGAAHFMGGEFDAAILDWTQAFELDADASALSNLGAALFFNGDFVAAAETYQRAHEMNPNNHTFPGNVGEAYYFAGDERASGFYQRASELAEQQLAINPDNYTALSSKACYHAALGEADQANATIRRAIELNEAEVYTWYDAARVYMRLNRQDEAVAAIRRALDLGYSRYLVEADANFVSIKELIGEIQE